MTGLGFTPDRRDLRDSGTGIEPPDQVLARAARYSQWDGSPMMIRPTRVQK